MDYEFMWEFLEGIHLSMRVSMQFGGDGRGQGWGTWASAPVQLFQQTLIEGGIFWEQRPDHLITDGRSTTLIMALCGSLAAQ